MSAATYGMSAATHGRNETMTRITKSAMVCALAAIGAATFIAPTAASADTSRATACAFYAEDTPYLDTGVGYAKNRKAAEDYECPTHSAGDGSDPGYVQAVIDGAKEQRSRPISIVIGTV